jgi:hypothetical protein
MRLRSARPAAHSTLALLLLALLSLLHRTSAVPGDSERPEWLKGTKLWGSRWFRGGDSQPADCSVPLLPLGEGVRLSQSGQPSAPILPKIATHGFWWRKAAAQSRAGEAWQSRRAGGDEELGSDGNDDAGDVGVFASLFEKPKSQSRDHAERRRREEAGLTARRSGDAAAYVASSQHSAPLFQQLAVAEQTVYQGCVHDAAHNHPCVKYAGGTLVKTAAVAAVTVVTLLHSFTIDVPSWTCSLCAQCIEVNPVDVRCFYSSPIERSIWFPTSFLDAAQNALLVGGLSLQGKLQYSTLFLSE